MLIINRKSSNPYFNITAEEYLVKNIDEPCFMLWQNSPSVIIGKHQNPLKEVNLEFTQKHSIPIIRRISGGGTVYHDLGNINYSFIDFGKRESLVNFAKYSQPIIDLLQKLKINAYLDGKSDLKINGLKFSGNASHVYKDRVLHHGTLLFNSDLNILNESIKIHKSTITDKAVNSNRTKVCNISEFLKIDTTIEEFKQELLLHIKMQFPQAKEVLFSKSQEQEIQKLADEKYTTWEWNFGYSPRYFVNASVIIEGATKEFITEVYKGFIQNISCDSSLPDSLQRALLTIRGKQHEIKTISACILDNSLGKYHDILMEILF